MTLTFEEFAQLAPTEKIVFVISACYLAKQKVFQDVGKSKNRFVYLEYLCNFLNKYQIEPEVQVMGFYNSFDFDMIAKYKLYTCKVFFDHFKSLNEKK
jgi:hypothetical protein